jgi:hypothetical protein
MWLARQPAIRWPARGRADPGRRVGRARLLSADPAGRYTRPLTELLTLAFGPHLVIGEEFGSLEAIAAGFTSGTP